MESNINIIIADDKEKYRRVICEILKDLPVTVIGEAANGKQLIELLRKKRPDIVLLDLEMPVMDGNKAFHYISKAWPEIKVMILSSYYESVLVENYMERGAKGYLPKDEMTPELLAESLQKVSEGKTYVFEKPTDRMKFTYRQKQIMPLIFEGLTNGEIASEVCINTRSVEKQRHKIYEKSGAQKMIDFYKYAFTKGLQFLGRQKKRRKSAA
jgi:DNA-binding NarL/FixJ family response regulator